MENQIIGIIVEFNPLHNGHLKLIEKIKKENPDSTIIAVMSGQFVQRGEIAIYDKWLRAEYAIKNNVNLVVEIPPFFVLNNANIFAKKSVEILNDFNVSKIYFGTENLDIDEINNYVEIIMSKNNELEKLKKEYHSLPKAFEKLINKKLNPNDTLGICYVLESRKMNLNIEFHRVKRINNKKNKSASKIRDDIYKKNKYKNSIIKSKNTRNINEYYEIIISKLLTTPSNNEVVKYVKNQLNNNKYEDFNNMIESIANKSFTKSKLKREIIKFILNLKGTDKRLILSMDEKGKKVLKNVESYSFRHEKDNEDNYNVEAFLSIKDKKNINELLKHKTIIF